jgi:hypothetical protein
MLFAITVTILSPETVKRHPGARHALFPHLSVPRSARREYVAVIPVMVSAWMLAGLFMGLMPTIIRELFDHNSGLLNGATSFVEPGAAAAAGLVLGRISSRRALRLGGTTILVGGIIVLIGIVAKLLALLWVGGIVGGVGFGVSFSGSLRMLGPLAEPNQRAGLFAALYAVAYLSFGVPVIIAGQLVPEAGLRATVIGYTTVILIATAIGLIAQSSEPMQPERAA